MQPAGVILYKNEVEETRVNSELKSVGAAGARTKKKTGNSTDEANIYSVEA